MTGPSGNGGGQRLPSLTVDGAPGTSYRIEASPNLAAQSWILLATVTLQGNRLSYVDTTATNALRRFYRAVPQ